MRVLVVFGTRPEAIKMCPVVLELKKQLNIETLVCVTGQHREMLHPVLEVFGVHADYDLEIMQVNQTLTMITQVILQKMDNLLNEVRPDLVLVHGDTTTAYATSLACFYHRIPVGHVEAGLRTGDIYSPFPEEYNRKAIDMVADLLFAPTDNAKQNLLNEGTSEEKIIVTGNTVIDAMSTTVSNDYLDDNLEWATGSRLILLTAHRRENLGEPMCQMFAAVRRIIADNPDVKCIYPVHMNPRVREIVEKELGGIERVRLIEPLDVVQFHNYIAHAYLVLTDSGGIQEEAPALNKPVLVMREVTERPEGIAAGTLRLVGTKEESIYETVNELLSNQETYDLMSNAVNPYGDGHASKRIVEVIKSYAGNLNCTSNI